MSVKNKIKAEFRLVIEHVEGVDDGQVYVLWRRGVHVTKAKHSGKTEKLAVDGGAAGPFREFSITSLLQQKAKNMAFEEKQLALTVKWLAPADGASPSSSSSSSRSSSSSKKNAKKSAAAAKRRTLGKALVNLGDLARNGVVSEVTCAAGPARVTVRCHCDWLSYNGKKLIKPTTPGGGKIEIGGVMYEGMQTERDLSDEEQPSELELSDWNQSDSEQHSYADSSMGGAYDDDFGDVLEDPFAADSGIAPSIPPVVVDLVEFLQDSHLDTQGLFRISGQPDVIQTILAVYAAGYAVARSEFDNNVHSVAGALKKYLRDMEPLLTFDLHDRFLELVDGADTTPARIAALTQLLPLLPPENLALLAYVCRFLTTCSLHKEINKMDASNLAVVFGPNFMRPRAESTDLNQAFAAMAKSKQLVELLIEQSDAVFRSVLALPSRAELERVTFDKFRKIEHEQSRGRSNKLSRMLKRSTSIRKLAQSAVDTVVPVKCSFVIALVAVVDVPHYLYEAASSQGGVVLKWYRGANKKDRGNTPVTRLYLASSSKSSTPAPAPASLSPRPASAAALPPTSATASSASLALSLPASAQQQDERYYSADFQVVASSLRFQGETTQITCNATIFKNTDSQTYDPRPFTFKLCLASETTGTQSLKTVGEASLDLAEYPPNSADKQLAILTVVMKDPKPSLRRPKIHLKVTSLPAQADLASASSPASSTSSSKSSSSSRSSKSSKSKGKKSSEDAAAALRARVGELEAKIAQLEAEIARQNEQLKTKDLEMERMIVQMSKINALFAAEK